MARGARAWLLGRPHAGLGVSLGIAHSGEKPPHCPLTQRQQSGAALLAAVLTASLVAVLTSAALALQWRAYEVEKAERTRLQAAWLLHGALDWARLVLREDARSGGIDHLGEPWAIPLRETRLSEFLAANGSALGADGGSSLEDAFLSGEIIDLQSRLNLTNLVASDGRLSEPDFETFQRLFAYLGLPEQDLRRITQGLVSAHSRSWSAQGTPLTPQRLDQLGWLGVPPSTTAAIKPYAILLPSRTALNLNTAPPEAIYSAIGSVSMADAHRMTQARLQAPFRTTTDAAKVLGTSGRAISQSEVGLGVSTQHFQVTARLRLDGAPVEQRWVVRRDVTDVQPLWME